MPVDYCPCCRNAYSHTLNEGMVIKETSPDWNAKSLMSIYINPDYPSLAISICFSRKQIFSAHLHLCRGKKLHFISDYFDESYRVKKKPSIRTQATRIVEKIVSDWNPAYIFIGTGNPDHPELIDNFFLPKIWEKKN